MSEQWAARWVVALSMVLIAAFSLITFLPAPVALPDYTRFLPVDMSLSQLGGIERNVPDAGTEPAAEPAAEATTSNATATITVHSANCRAKPRGNAEKLALFYSGQELRITGRNDDLNNPWWYVEIPDSTEKCWLWGMTAAASASVEDIPVVP